MELECIILYCCADNEQVLLLGMLALIDGLFQNFKSFVVLVKQNSVRFL
jgi:hypothetical protein